MPNRAVGVGQVDPCHNDLSLLSLGLTEGFKKCERMFHTASHTKEETFLSGASDEIILNEERL